GERGSEVGDDATDTRWQQDADVLLIAPRRREVTGHRNAAGEKLQAGESPARAVADRHPERASATGPRQGVMQRRTVLGPEAPRLFVEPLHVTPDLGYAGGRRQGCAERQRDPARQRTVPAAEEAAIPAAQEA